ncbi:adenosine receptor A3-like [Hemicordylus capensis]|uniref:adenosine receptor A3-like n=1 Tax=Hemicordylus capensis TaxID=884348 RepID=UPI0023042A8F|nr:adenosine receptor A3-like [Hemicordylus capensis]
MTAIMDYVYFSFEAVIAVLAILGNALVIWVIKLNPAFQKTVFYFIISLALADICVGLVMPVAIVLTLDIQMQHIFCVFMCCLPVAFTQASIMSLLAIAIDRYLRLRLLTRYKMITSRKRICMALGIVWLLALVMGFLPMFGWATGKEENSTSVTCNFTAVMDMEYMVYFSFFFGTLVPLILMIILYAKIFCIIQTKLKQCSLGIRGTGIFYRQEYKTAKSLALVLFLFAVCWLPMCILNTITHFNKTHEIPRYVVQIGILLTHSNSVMNPIIYAFRIKKFRETCIQIFRTYDLCKDPERDVPHVTTASEHI